MTIPYCLVACSASDANNEKVAALRQRAHDLLELKTDIVASTPHAYEALVEPYLGLNGRNTGNNGNNEGDERPFPAQSELNLLQKQLQSEETGGWQFTCIPRVYSINNGNAKTVSPKEDETRDGGDNRDETDMDNGAVGRESGDGVTGGTEGERVITKHMLPTIRITSPVNPGPLPLFPVAYFSLYADQDVEVSNNLCRLFRPRNTCWVGTKIIVSRFPELKTLHIRSCGMFLLIRSTLYISTALLQHAI